MSKYTITIKNLIDNKFQFNLKSYPIFDENYRPTLNQKILDHYYESEIGLETAELFNHYLATTLNEIMPKYNILYENQKKLIDNLTNNLNYKETFKQDSSSSGNSTSSSTNDGKNVYLDTPQGNSYKGTINDTPYATDVTFNQMGTNDKTTSSSLGTSNYIREFTGFNGTKYPIEILKDIENNFINIDLMIINDLQDLFMGIY